MSINYQDILDFAKKDKDKIIEAMKVRAALGFVSRLNNEGFNDSKGLEELKVEVRAISIAGEVLENVIEKMEKGAT